jgi:FKBP-type peptidyl-prolyl cis-trans isomerase FkpA
MKKYFLLLGLIIIVISSCTKSDSNTVSAAQQAATDNSLILAYIKANNITATEDASGVYYSIQTPGTGADPTTSSTVTVSYTGKLLNGTVFDSSPSLTSPLSGLILGWQYGLPFINTGGSILLIIPSALGYGTTSPGAGIPANSVLVFTITLTSFTNSSNGK